MKKRCNLMFLLRHEMAFINVLGIYKCIISEKSEILF